MNICFQNSTLHIVANLSTCKLIRLTNWNIRGQMIACDAPYQLQLSCTGARGGWDHSDLLSWWRWPWTGSWQRERAAGWQSWGLQGKMTGSATYPAPSGPLQTGPRTLRRDRTNEKNQNRKTCCRSVSPCVLEARHVPSICPLQLVQRSSTHFTTFSINTDFSIHVDYNLHKFFSNRILSLASIQNQVSTVVTWN